MLDGVRGLWNRFRGERIFTTPGARRRFLVHVIVASAIGLVVLALVWPQLQWLGDVANLRAYVAGFGPLAPAALIGIQTLQVVFAPVPGQPIAAAAGYLFGTWWGTLYSMVGIVLGSTIAFWLARRLGRPYVEGILDPAIVERFDTVPDDHVRVGLFILFLVPGLPDDAICFVGGLSRIPLWQLVGLAAVGRLPAFFLVNHIGDRAWAGDWTLVGVLALALVLVSLLGLYYRDRLLEGVTERSSVW